MANRPKGKLFALLAIFAAIGLVAASGAFSTVTAERVADVSVAGDSAALLALQPLDDNYASLDGNSQLQIELTNANLNALTEIEPVFNITNQGSNTVYVWIEKTGGNASAVQFFNTSGSGSIVGSNSANINITTQGNAKTLGTGTSMNVSMEIDTRNMNLGAGDELLSNITIHANSTDPTP